MTDSVAVAEVETLTRTWSLSSPHVRKALSLIKKGNITTTDDLIIWDRDHGQRLLDWHDPTAAAWARKAQAVLFFNRFRGMFDKMRVRAIIHVREDADADIDESGYFTVEAIAAHPGMRSQVIEDITRRMKMLASELRMWKLTANEQAILFERLTDSLAGRKDEAA